MYRTIRLPWPALVCVALGMLAGAAPASAHSTGGGMSYVEPEVTEVKCGTGSQDACPRGQVLRLSGEGLQRTRVVTFLGGRGTADDRRAKPTEKSPHRVIVAVPAAARSGPVRVSTAEGIATGPRLKVLGALPTRPASLTATPAADGGVFPIQGPHEYGTHTNRFGGGRGHEGQDVFADCGTPLVAAMGGTVTVNQFHSRAGNYVVVQTDDGTGHAYMHLQAPSPVAKGERVVAGQPIGKVGDTGRATGCHLHFELWTAPGYYEGGSPIDPLATLKKWDAATAPVSTAARR